MSRVTDYAVLVPAQRKKVEWDVVHVVEGRGKRIARGIENNDEAYEIAKAASPNPRRSLDCVICGCSNPDGFMVYPALWRLAGLGRGWAHLECLETQLDRKLTIEDFNLTIPMNRTLAFGYRLGRGDHA